MRVSIVGVVAPLLLLAAPSPAAFTFTDAFDAGPSPLWSNLRGNWFGHDGVYDAAAPANSPTTHTSLPFHLPDLTIEVDVNSATDGGIWLHTDDALHNGVLLVTGGGGWGSGNRDAQAGNSLYFHTITGGVFSGITNRVTGVFTPGTNLHLRVTVTGDTYAVYLNGSATPATTLTTAGYPAGRVGLYDFSATQTFDNFTVTSPLIPGDADADGDVDLDDQGIWASNFTGSLTPGAGTSTFADGDFDFDRDVDLDDQGIWASNFTGSLAPSLLAVPEPGAGAAAVVALLPVTRGRRGGGGGGGHRGRGGAPARP